VNTMPLKEKLTLILGAILYVGMFGFALVFCLQGLFANDIAVEARSVEPSKMVYVGYPKLLFCLSGMGMSLMMLCLPLIAFVARVSKKEVRWRVGSPVERVFIPVVAASLTGLVIAYIWQGLLNPVYR